MNEKNNILCGILKPSTLRSEEIYSIFEDYWYTQLCQMKKNYKYWFPHDLSFLRNSRNCKYFKFFSTLFVWYTQPLSDNFFLSIGFHKTCHFSWFQGIANISSFVFHTFCLVYPASVRQNFSKYWFPKDLSFFRISKNWK